MNVLPLNCHPLNENHVCPTGPLTHTATIFGHFHLRTRTTPSSSRKKKTKVKMIKDRARRRCEKGEKTKTCWSWINVTESKWNLLWKPTIGCVFFRKKKKKQNVKISRENFWRTIFFFGLKNFRHSIFSDRKKQKKICQWASKGNLCESRQHSSGCTAFFL